MDEELEAALMRAGQQIEHQAGLMALTRGVAQPTTF